MCDSRTPPLSGLPWMWKKSGATSKTLRLGVDWAMTGPTTVVVLESSSWSEW